MSERTPSCRAAKTAPGGGDAHDAAEDVGQLQRGGRAPVLDDRRQGRARAPTSRTWPAPCRCRTAPRPRPTRPEGRSKPATAARPATPTASEAPPTETRDERRPANRCWPCTHEPADQPTAPTVSMAPATVAPSPRLRISISGTNVMAPLKDAVSRNRLSITDGRPRRHPQRAAGQQPRAGQRATPTRPSHGRHQRQHPHRHQALRRPTAWRPRPARRRARAPRSRRCSAAGVGLCSWSASPRICSRRAATTTIVTATGTTTTRKTHRQENVSASHPATGGPTSDGSTHAAEIQLKTRGRSVCRGRRGR